MTSHSNQLLIATHNPAKKQELKEGFSHLLTLSLLSLDDFHITADPEETGSTFLENARLKARFFAQISQLPTVADDGGIEIDYLKGEPGVHSKRWLGRDATDEELMQHTLTQLMGVPLEKRTAQLTVCLYYCNPITNKEYSVTESIKGTISTAPSTHARYGFPYRALFIVSKYNEYYDELSNKEHLDINHRLNAVKKLKPFIKEDLIQ